MALRKATKEDVTLWVLSGQTLCLDCMGTIDVCSIVHCKACQKRHRTDSSKCPNYRLVTRMKHLRKDQHGNVTSGVYEV